MKKLLVTVFIFTGFVAFSQRNVDGLINAEKSFAAYSVDHSMKDAFLKFLDSTGIVFEKGEPVNGMESWNKKEKRPGLLNWHPQFAEISASGDFGYTTGPWTFQPKTISDSVVARGQYTTVWRMNKNGEWKFLVDLGVNDLPATDSAEVQKIKQEKITAPIDLASLVKTEEQFFKAFKKNKKEAYSHFLSGQSILNRNNILPAITATERDQAIEATPKNLRFTINGSRIATSGDLGCVYGTIEKNGSKENFLHIWRRENEGWKIAVEVLRYPNPDK